MDKLLSIIVPSYNMENYLSRNLDSLIVGEPLFDLVDVIVVNDGSKDRTSEIAHDYAKRYPDSIRVIDKPNGNYGSCINAALPLASGKYVKVIDADDYVDTQAFSKYIQWLLGNDADLVLNDYDVVDLQGRVTSTKHYGYSESLAISDVGSAFIEIHAVTYRTAMVLRLEYVQTEGVSYSDSEWVTLPMAGVTNVSYFAFSLVKYLVGRQGQTMDPAVAEKNSWMSRKVAINMAAKADKFWQTIANGGCGTKYMLSAVSRIVAWKYLNIVCRGRGLFPSFGTLSVFDAELKRASKVVYDRVAKLAVVGCRRRCYIAVEWRRHRMRSFVTLTLVRWFVNLNAKH